MPRIYSSSNDPFDFCAKCFPSMVAATYRFAECGDGPDGRGNCFSYESEHPPYEDENYHCCKCKKSLTEKDN